MAPFDRRTMLKTILCASAAAVFAETLIAPGPAKAAPLPIDKLPAAPPANLIEEARVVVHHHHHHGWRHHRHRRQTCWWRHGRRVCTWR